ncbi:uncharacterized protein LOC135371204 isoform X2 [Ornithodoros turicata]|uniref:uncharacterized protein LOC135371204 isoform X2 n=1 Tax=Ornithodoros turicata TaxID=34597 RepID=UPI003138EA29
MPHREIMKELVTGNCTETTMSVTIPVHIKEEPQGTSYSALPGNCDTTEDRSTGRDISGPAAVKEDPYGISCSVSAANLTGTRKDTPVVVFDSVGVKEEPWDTANHMNTGQFVIGYCTNATGTISHPVCINAEPQGTSFVMLPGNNGATGQLTFAGCSDPSGTTSHPLCISRGPQATGFVMLPGNRSNTEQLNLGNCSDATGTISHPVCISGAPQGTSLVMLPGNHGNTDQVTTGDGSDATGTVSRPVSINGAPQGTSSVTLPGNHGNTEQLSLGDCSDTAMNKQRLYLLQLLEESPELSNNRVRRPGETKLQRNQKWGEIAKKVNAMGPVYRTATAWMQLWKDWRYRVRSRARGVVQKLSGCSSSSVPADGGDASGDRWPQDIVFDAASHMNVIDCRVMALIRREAMLDATGTFEVLPGSSVLDTADTPEAALQSAPESASQSTPQSAAASPATESLAEGEPHSPQPIPVERVSAKPPRSFRLSSVKCPLGAPPTFPKRDACLIGMYSERASILYHLQFSSLDVECIL